jgi:hypothetical protein
MYRVPLGSCARALIRNKRVSEYLWRLYGAVFTGLKLSIESEWNRGTLSVSGISMKCEYIEQSPTEHHVGRITSEGPQLTKQHIHVVASTVLTDHEIFLEGESAVSTLKCPCDNGCTCTCTREA